MKQLFLLCTLMLLLVPGLSHAQAAEKGLVILANENLPESIELAEYYAGKRGIPLENICRLDLPVTEDITRTQFTRRMRDPLVRFLRDGEFIRQVHREIRPAFKDRLKGTFNRWRGKPPDENTPSVVKVWETVETSVHFLVPMYGVPLRISSFKDKVEARTSTHQDNLREKDIAAVDSELSLSLFAGYNVQGSFRNPVYNAVTWGDAGGAGAMVMICSRLDGPSPEIVRRMIDDSLAAERYGLHGRAYIDARGIRKGGYFVGDYWMQTAYNRFKLTGYDAVLDSSDPLFPDLYPMEDAAIYLGWYTEHVDGAIAREGFQFAQGAIAYHLHSGAAKTLRSGDEHWAGPLLTRGAAATMGAVHEPYLRMTIDLDIFSHRICSGYSFGESAYMALPVLSWQMAIIGDPLYRPFMHTLDKQIAHMELDGVPQLEWGYARKVLQLVREGFFNVALNYARDKVKATDSLVLRELLADLYLKNNLIGDAAIQYEYVQKHTESPATSIRVAQRWCSVLIASGDIDRAERIRNEVKERWPDNPMLAWLDREQF